jgi:DNA-binding LacI/PurR family transcriptional regulator
MLNRVVSTRTLPDTDKWQQTAQLLRHRVTHGDYAIRRLPTETELAGELEVSRSTARRAIHQLMDDVVIERRRHGKLVIRQAGPDTVRPHLALLSRAFSSIEYQKWQTALVHEAHALGANVRLITYVHWDDPNVSHTLAGFDGTFIVPSTEAIPPHVRNALSRGRNVFSLGVDLSELGLPAVQLMPSVFVHRLGDHLLAQGHRRIDCPNTQPCNEVIRARLAQWAFWKDLHGVSGEVLSEPVEPFAHPTPQAYRLMRRHLQDDRFEASALLCITDDAAGAIRALHECGRAVGRDVAVCSVEGGPFGRYRVPSRTCLVEPPAGPYLRACIASIAGGGPWAGPMLVQPSDVSLFVGESTSTRLIRTL